MFELENDAFTEADRLLQTAARLERLAANLRAIHEGTGPTEDDLANAPVIENWATEFVPAKVLFGHVTSNLPGEYFGFCSTDLWVLAEPRGWALTLERWYRLGAPEKLQE